MGHNDVVPNSRNHFNKDWQEKVKTWFNQPGRKLRRRQTREKKAKLSAPCPTNKLRPAVRGQTNKYNSRIKLGRGFTAGELKLAGMHSLPTARSIGIAVDVRRKDTCNETLNMNSNRIKAYLAKIIVHRVPVKNGKNVPSKLFKEANFKTSTDAAVKVQNTSRDVVPLPKSEAGFEWTTITKTMTDVNAYKTIRTEWKKATGFYTRLENAKKKASAPKK